jgi:hypothetical protein
MEVYIMASQFDELAERIQQQIFEAHRGAFPLPTKSSPHRHVLFGNDGYGSDPGTKRYVKALWTGLRKAGFVEDGFGLDGDKYTWVLVVTPPDRIVAQMGEALLTALDTYVWIAWRDCRSPGAPELYVFGTESHTLTRSFQVATARRTIGNWLDPLVKPGVRRDEPGAGDYAWAETLGIPRDRLRKEFEIIRQINDGEITDEEANRQLRRPD